MIENEKSKLAIRASRASGQVAAIHKMILDDRYCVDILIQIAAARSALDALGVELLTTHLETCVTGKGSGSEHECAMAMSSDELLVEVKSVLQKFLR